MGYKTIFLLICLKFALIASQATISCNYAQQSSMQPYTCYLTINNPDGLDDFTTIPGQHLPNRGNSDVEIVSAAFQNTRIIPSVICRQFPNVREIYIPSSRIEEINNRAFAECSNLLSVTLINNNVTEIPPDTFRNTTRLFFLNIALNNIQSINPDSFAGSALSYIDLTNNQISEVAHGTFAPLSETLVTLFLSSNQLTSLPEGAFGYLESLEVLHLSSNPFTALPNILFRNLVNLRVLFMINCGISEPNPMWFNYLRSLTTVHLESNGITALPVGLFARSRRLTNIFLGANNLTELSAAAFGTNAPAMELINLIGNSIRGIDEEFFEVAVNLHTLYLNGNECLDENLEFRFEDRNRIRTQLTRCFRGFGPEFIRCRYEFVEDDYSCHMSIRNPIGNEFSAIEGEHLSGQGNDNIRIVDIVSGNTRNFPQIICQQFPQVRDMLIYDDFIEVINAQSFASCVNLERLHLGKNLLTMVPFNTFANNARLRELYLGSNRISMIHPTSFTGTVIEILDVSDNLLSTVHAVWFEPIRSTLRSLDMIFAQITNIPSDAFSNLTALNMLYLNGNSLTGLNGDVFASLTNLRELGLSNCDLNELNPQWFATLSNLHRLYIIRNNLREFPDDLFSPLTRLMELIFYDNHIVELREESFGASLQNLRLLYGSNNLINVFDAEILDRGAELDSLIFSNNLCIDASLTGIRGNLQLVRERLVNCTTNYEAVPTISCTYERMITGRIYWCQMTAINPSGRNDFERVEGEHLVGGNDDSVIYVQVERQNTRVVPSVICNQFTGMQILDLIESNIFEITEATFEGCDFLRDLTVMGNSIRSLPNNAFIGARNHLQVLVLANNGIDDISPYAFARTGIRELDLTHNRIRRYDAYTFSQIGQTLRILRLTDNRIQSLPPNAFDLLTNLVDLELNGNQITTIPHNAFLGSTSLRILQISNNGLERLEPGAFSALENLEDLELSLNRLDLLPENIFDLPSLRTLGLVQNRFRSLDAAAFGRSLGTILNIDASLNRIDAIDPTIISEESSLRNLNLAYNGCSNGNFGNIPQNRPDIVRALDNCINNYNNVSLNCEFEDVGETLYVCNLSIDNENDRLRFSEITGEHLEDGTDESVRSVSAIDQNSRIIPSIICERFRYVESLIFANSNVEVITSNALSSCELLYSLNLAGNRIVDIPERVFINNEYLSILNLANNRIEMLHSRIFEGTQIYALDLELNRLQTFNPIWFDEIETTLMTLFLHNNQIRRFPSHAFSSYSRLSVLELSGNQAFIPSNAFESLSQVYILHLANCGIRHLNHRWFDDLSGLSILELDNNAIAELPINIFEMPLLHLGIDSNQIEVLDSRSFSANLNEFLSLSAGSNRINAIDRRIIDSPSGLNSLVLTDNVCANNTFVDVRDNLDVVLDNLSGCFNNFQEN